MKHVHLYVHTRHQVDHIIIFFVCVSVLYKSYFKIHCISMKLREMSLFFKIPPWVFGAYLISSFLVSRMSILFLALVMLASPAKTLSSSDILSSCSIYKMRNYYPKENDIRKYCNVSTPAVLIPAMLLKYDSDCYTVYKSIINSLLIPCRIYDKPKALGSTSILHV